MRENKSSNNDENTRSAFLTIRCYIAAQITNKRPRIISRLLKHFTHEELQIIYGGIKLFFILLAFVFLEFAGRLLLGYSFPVILFLRAIPLTLVFAAPVFFAGRFSFWYAACIVFLSALLCFLQLESTVLFDAPVNKEIFDIIALTNFSELNDFCVTFISLKSVAAGVFTAVIATISIMIIFRHKFYFSSRLLIVALIMMVPFGIQAFRIMYIKQLSAEELFNKNVLTHLIYQYGLFNQDQRRLNASVFKPVFPKNIKRKQWIDDSNFLGVVLIGESTPRSHLGIYGYSRNTTPELEKLKDRLFVYNNVISGGGITGDALKAAFIVENPDYVFNIANLCKRAGYSIVFISNREYLGYDIGYGINEIFSKGDQIVYLAARPDRKNTYDQALLDQFNKILPICNKPTIVFMHMMGTHYIYSNRYPPEFARFDNVQDKENSHVSKDKAEIINKFDNANLYNEYIVSSFIKIIDASNRPGFVYYFSDHGEAMYEDGKTVYHNVNTPSRYIYEIPMLIWVSEDYKKHERDFVGNFGRTLDQPMQGFDIIYSLLDIMRISYNGFPYSRSIFSTQYMPAKRFMCGKDYDEMVKSGFKKSRN